MAITDLNTYLETAEKALKDYYLPAWQNQLYIEPTVMLEKIGHENVMSDKITAAAEIGLSGGFGFGEEGLATPKAGRVMFERFTTRTKDMFVNVVISDKAVKLSGSSGSMFNLLDTEIKAAYAAAKWNVGRSMFGDGTGKLADVVAQSSKSKNVKIKSHKLVKEGLIVDFYTTSGATAAQAGLRIVAVDRKADSDGYFTITLDKEPSAAIAAGFMTVQNSYKREIDGLGAIFDDNIATLYGVTKSANPIIKPTVIDAAHDLADDVITQALSDAHDYKNSNVDVLLAGNKAYTAYVNYLRLNNYRVETTDGTLKGGFKGIKFLFGNREVEIYNENFVPDNEIWGIETDKWKIYDNGWNFMQLKGGGIFNLMEDTSSYRATLANYGNLICSNPGGCVRITNCDPTTTTTG